MRYRVSIKRLEKRIKFLTEAREESDMKLVKLQEDFSERLSANRIKDFRCFVEVLRPLKLRMDKIIESLEIVGGKAAKVG